MRKRNARRTAALVVIGSLALSGTMAAASAESSVQGAIELRRDMRTQIQQLHEHRHDRRMSIHRKIRHALVRIQKFRNVSRVGIEWIDRFRAHQHRLARSLSKEERSLVKGLRTRVAALRERRSQLLDWIDVYGVFRRCPVDGTNTVADNFGVTVRLPKVPVHTHMGNDITAASGTPIVAPFDGTAIASSNELGGLAVKVYGEAGYVYNAHLSSYGTLGAVSTGTVIGYVGTTGDATGPHDHFEWHPDSGLAVDPNPYLSLVC